MTDHDIFWGLIPYLGTHRERTPVRTDPDSSLVASHCNHRGADHCRHDHAPDPATIAAENIAALALADAELRRCCPSPRAVGS